MKRNKTSANSEQTNANGKDIIAKAAEQSSSKEEWTLWRHGRGHTLRGKDPSCPEALLYANFAPLNIFFLLSTDKTKVAKVTLFLLIALS